MSCYACDLYIYLTEDDNVDGTFVLGTESAKQFIRDHWDVAGDAFQDARDNEGVVLNPFENPESFTFYMELYGVRNLLNESAFIQDNWEEEIVLTPEVINQIKAEISRALDKEQSMGGR